MSMDMERTSVLFRWYRCAPLVLVTGDLALSVEDSARQAWVEDVPLSAVVMGDQEPMVLGVDVLEELPNWCRNCDQPIDVGRVYCSYVCEEMDGWPVPVDDMERFTR